MEIIIGKNAGFCYGVENAVSKTRELLKNNNQIDCLGELVHNGEVVKQLRSLGLRVVENIEEVGTKVIIRAHGIPNEIYDKAQILDKEIFDFTCPNVLKIHKIAEEYSNKNYFIFLIGNKKHPETVGTISFCGQNSYIIENIYEIDSAIEKLRESKLKDLLIIVQTTFSVEKFNEITNKINEQLHNIINLKIIRTICNATQIRQEETLELSKKVDCMIIIGGKNSSNTKKLYDIAKVNCKNVFLIENEHELDIDKIKEFNKVGIMAGASTPQESINKTIGILK